MAYTAITNIVNPEVLADMASAKFPTELKISDPSNGLVVIDSSSALGTEGTIFTIPSYARIGSFGALVEGTPATPGNITTLKERAEVQRGILAQQVLDTAMLVGRNGDKVLDELSTQIARRAAEYVDSAVVAKLDNTPNVVDITASGAGTMTVDAVTDAMLKLGDQHTKMGGGKLVMHSKVYGDLLKLGLIQNDYQSGIGAVRTGRIPVLSGFPVIVCDTVTTTAVTSPSTFTRYNTYLVGPNALGLFYQKQLNVEFDRDILLKSSILSADIHFAPHLFGVDSISAALIAQDARSVWAVKILSK